MRIHRQSKIGLGVWAGPIPFVFFVFFARRPEETLRPIATLNGSYDAVSAKEVPFGGLDDEK